MHLFADSAPAYTAKTAQRLLAEFRFLADWAPYSPNLNPLDFDTRHVLQATAQATPHTNFAALRPSVAAKWDRLAAVQIRKTSVFAGDTLNSKHQHPTDCKGVRGDPIRKITLM
jgi:hypothetical protein